MSLKEKFDKLLAFENDQEQFEHEAQMLAFQFLAKIDKKMEKLEMSKKELAQRVGTSPSFITQMFRGDRKPNWNILAKMQKELNLEFKIVTNNELKEIISQEISEYHRKWIKSREYEKIKGLPERFESVLSIEEENDYALAG